MSRRDFIAPSVLVPLAAAIGPVAAAPGGKAEGKGGRVLVAYFSRSGNTRVIAGQLGRSLKASLFEILPAKPYPEDYLETVLSGNTLIPFVTHGGYGVGTSLAVVAAHAPGARLADAALVMQADQERQTMERVTRWLGTLSGPGQIQRL